MPVITWKKKLCKNQRVEFLISKSPEQSKSLSINEKIHLYLICVAFKDSPKYMTKVCALQAYNLSGIKVEQVESLI